MDRTELIRFVEGKLNHEKAIEVDEHVKVCEQCKGLLNSLPQLKRVGTELAESLLDLHKCPEYEEISAYVDEKLTPEQVSAIQVHLNSCETCFADVERIREMRSHAGLREKIVVQPNANRQQVAAGTDLWKRVLATVSGAALIAGLAVAIGSFTASPENPAIVASKPPVESRGTNVAPSVGPADTSSSAEISTKSPETVATGSKPDYKTVLKDGSYRVIEADGKLALADTNGKSVKTQLEARIAAAIDEKLRTGKINPAEPVQMAMASVKMRDGESYVAPPTAPKLIGPSDRIVMSNTPMLSWSKVDLAESYRVRVYDSDFQMVLDKTTSNTRLGISKALARGEEYTWRVGVRFSESDSWAESAPTKFYVLSAQDYASIQKVKKALPSSHLALGAAYESFGLKHEAQQEYRALRRSNRSSSLARKILYRTN